MDFVPYLVPALCGLAAVMMTLAARAPIVEDDSL